jgi:uncharacterized GH25 family protein
MNRHPTAWRRLSVGLLALTLAARAAAHDFWIEPASFAPEPGQAVTVRLLVGEHFSGAAVARPEASGMHRFVVVDADRNVSVTLPGRTGAEPAGMFRPPRPGAYVIGFHGKPNAIELAPEKFNAYLRDEGLDAVLALRAQRDQLGQPGREIYSRCAKSLVLTSLGCAACQPADRELGFALELIAERQPRDMREGELLPVRLLFEGQPLAGALVVALRRTDPASRTTLRSDADGRVLLAMPHDGQWLVKAVHMRPAQPGSGADWESLWASLSFSIGSDR